MCPINRSLITHESWLKFGNFPFSFQWGQKTPKNVKIVILVVNWLNNIIATGSEVSLDWVEAATNTFGELAPHLVSVVTGQSSSRRFQ